MVGMPYCNGRQTQKVTDFAALMSLAQMAIIVPIQRFREINCGRKIPKINHRLMSFVFLAHDFTLLDA